MGFFILSSIALLVLFILLVASLIMMLFARYRRAGLKLLTRACIGIVVVLLVGAAVCTFVQF